MTDAEQTTEEVTQKTVETTASKVGKKASKKTARKAVKTLAENVVEERLEASSEPVSEQTSKDDDKRARLVDKLKAMGVMAGSKSAAAATSATKGLNLSLPKWLSPQIVAVVAGACVFSVLIWSLEQEKPTIPQQTARPVQQMYNPYAMPPASGPYPTYPAPAPQAQNAFDPATQGRAQVMQEPPTYPVPPGYNPYAMAPPPAPYPAQQAQNKPSTDSQTGSQTSQNRQAYPPQGSYPNRYGYGYGYHPAMRFGFNGQMQGNGAPSYYGHAPYGRPRGYGYPPPASTGQQR